MKPRLLVVAVVFGAAAACANIAGIAEYEIVDRDDASGTNDEDGATTTTTIDGASSGDGGAIDSATSDSPSVKDALVVDATTTDDADTGVVFPPRSVKCGDNGLECATFCCRPVTAGQPSCGDAGDSATCPSTNLRYDCDEPADCPNQLCCGERYTLNGNVFVISGHCEPTCSGPIFCTKQADCLDGGQCTSTMSGLPSSTAKACQ